jgi:hypothetical protein
MYAKRAHLLTRRSIALTAYRALQAANRDSIAPYSRARHSAETPNKKRKPRLGESGVFLGKRGSWGEIRGFIHKTREPGIKFRQQRRSSGIYSLGGVALIAEVPQILQPIICLAGPAKGSTMYAGTV